MQILDLYVSYHRKKFLSRGESCRICNIDMVFFLWYNFKLKLIIIFKSGESFMAEKTTYKTRQRDEILRFFTEHKDCCFSARDLIGQVDAGEATVFRALATLTNEGKLKKIHRRQRRKRVLSVQRDRMCAAYPPQMPRMRETDPHGLRVHGGDSRTFPERAFLPRRLRSDGHLRSLRKL